MTRKRGKSYMLSLLTVLSILLILIPVVSASRLPTVGGDSDQWGTILNEYLNKLSGQNATELNQTMVNGTNIYSSSINTSHIEDNTITDSDILNTTNITTTGYGFFDYLGSLTNRVTSLFAQDVNFNGTINFTGPGDFIVNNSDLFVDVSTGRVGIGTASPNVKLQVNGSVNISGTGVGDFIVNNSDLFVDVSTGNVGIGTTGPGDYNDAGDNLVIYETGGQAGLTIATDNNQRGNVIFTDGTAYEGYIEYDHNAPDKMNFGTALSTRMTIDNSGNIGIGDTGPDGLLEVSASGGASDLLLLSSDDGTEGDRFIVKNDGKVGIGTTGPSGLMHLSEDLNNAGIATPDAFASYQLIIEGGIADDDTAGVVFALSTTVPYASIVATDQGTSNRGALRFSTNDGTMSEHMIINYDGNLGIGTSAPTTQLQLGTGTLNFADGANDAYIAGDLEVDGTIYGSVSGVDTTDDSWTGTGDVYTTTGNVGIGTTGPEGNLEIKDTGASLTDPQIAIEGSGGSDDDFAIWAQSGNNKLNIGYGGTNSGTFITFDAGTGGTFEGNVGIGTTSPTFDSGGGLHISRTGGASALQLDRTDGTKSHILAGSTGLELAVDEADSVANSIMTFRVDNSEAMRIDDSGNIGIGTTGPLANLHIDRGSGSTTTLYITEGTNDDYGGYFKQISNANTFEIGYLVGGTENPTIYLSETNAGNVGIGTTGPNYKLHVNGTFRVQNASNTTGLFVDGDGNVGIGTTAPAKRFHVNDSAEGSPVRFQDTDGTCDADPDAGGLTWSCSSDIKLKTNIKEADTVLDELMKLRIRDYVIKASGDEMTGLIAQEALEDNPQLIKEKEDGTLMVSEIPHWKIIKAIQELAQMQTQGYYKYNKSTNLSVLNLTDTNLTTNITIDTENTEKKTIQTKKGSACVFMKNGVLQSIKGKCNESQNTQDLSNLTTPSKTQKPEDTNKQVIEDNKNISNITQDKESESISEESKPVEQVKTTTTNESSQDLSNLTTQPKAQKPENNKEQIEDNNISNTSKDKKPESDEETKADEAPQPEHIEDAEIEESAEQEKEPEDVEVKTIGITGNIINFFKLTGKTITGFIVKQEPETDYADEFDTLAIKNIQELKQENLKLKQKSEALENQLKVLKQELCIQNPWHTWC